jgi:hypothetical protein
MDIGDREGRVRRAVLFWRWGLWWGIAVCNGLNSVLGG